MGNFIRKAVFILLVGMLAIVVLAAVISQTALFKNWLRDLLVREVNQSLNAELSLGRLDGNLFTDIKVSDALLAAGPDTLATLGELCLTFDPFGLFRRQIRVRLVSIKNFNGFLQQYPDGSWNVSSLVRSESKQDSSSSAPFDWSVLVRDLEIENLSLFVCPLENSPIPRQLTGLNMTASARYASQKLFVNLENTTFQTAKPALTLEKLAFSLHLSGDSLSVENLSLWTGQSRISGDALLVMGKNPFIEGRLLAQPLVLQEVHPFLQTELPDLAPELVLEAALEDSAAQIDLLVRDENQSLHVKATTGFPFSGAGYELNVDMENLDIQSLVSGNLPVERISGSIVAKGRGIDPKNMVADFQAKLTGQGIAEPAVKSVKLEGQWKRGGVNARLNAAGKAGSINGRVNLMDIFTVPRYSLNLTVDDLNLATVLGDTALTSSINATVKAQGKEFDPEKMTASVALQMLPSVFAGFSIDSLELDADVLSGLYRINRLHVVSPYGDIDGTAAADANGLKVSDVQIKPRDLTRLPEGYRPDSLSTEGFVSLQAFGRWDSLHVNTLIKLENLSWMDNRVSVVEGGYNGYLTGSGLDGKARLRADGGSFGGMSIDSLEISSSIERQRLQVRLDARANDTLQVHAAGEVFMDSTTSVRVDELELAIGTDRWEKPSNPAEIRVERNRIEIDNFKLLNGVQAIGIDGTIDPEGPINIQAHLADVELAALVKNAGVRAPWPFYAKCDMDVFLKGTPVNPTVTAGLAINDIKVRTRQLPSLLAEATYQNHALQMLTTLRHTDAGEMVISATLPVHFSLVDSSEWLQRDKPAKVIVKAENFRLGFISALTPANDQLSGGLNARLEAENILPEPALKGELSISGGSYSFPEYGLDYKDITIKLAFADDRLTIKDLSASAGAGKLSAQGEALFEKDKILLGPRSINVNLKGQRVQLAKSNFLEMIANTDILLAGSADSLKFGGKVELLRSRTDLTALQNRSSRGPRLSRPRLVQALKDSVISDQATARAKVDFGKNLSGRLSLHVPRNTWLRSDDMNIELSGDLEIVKEGPTFELFGTVQTLRGSYNLYGRRFNIKEGKVVFQGGREINPEIILEALYTFRDIDGKKATLTLKTAGTLLKPELAFLLDDSPIEEADGLSYILFGKSSNELSRGETTAMSRQTGGAAQFTSLVSGQVTGQLTEVIQRTFNLDVMEFRGSSNWRQASILIGKYLTNNLFMAYEREFSAGQSGDVIPEKVSLEYEITPRFYIQATKGDDRTTGVDLIIKFEKK